VRLKQMKNKTRKKACDFAPYPFPISFFEGIEQAIHVRHNYTIRVRVSIIRKSLIIVGAQHDYQLERIRFNCERNVLIHQLFF